jgi:hypothetical protein
MDESGDTMKWLKDILADAKAMLLAPVTYPPAKPGAYRI